MLKLLIGWMYFDFLSAFLSDVGYFLQPARKDFYFESIPQGWAFHWQPFCGSRLPETVSAPAPTAEPKSEESLSEPRHVSLGSPTPIPLTAVSIPFPLRVARLFTPPCLRTNRCSVGGFHREQGRGRKGRSLIIIIIIITFTPFIISKHHHHHHQRDEACLRSLETYRTTKPAAAAPNKMNRVDRKPSPDAVWCSTFYYLFIFLIWKFLDFVGRANEHWGLASSWMNDADFTSTLI